MHAKTLIPLVVTIVFGLMHEIPLITCKNAEDMDIDNYVLSLLMKFRKAMIYPHPDLDLPKLDPLDLSNITFDITQGDNRLTGNIPNITIWKMSQFTLEYLHVNVEEEFANFTVSFPTILANLTFTLEGNIGNVSIEKSNGSGWIQLTDINITDGFLQLGHDSDSYFVKNIDFDFTFNGTSGYLYRLKGKDITEEELNNLLQGVAADIINGYKKHIIKFASETAMKLENKIFNGRTISDVVDIIYSWN